MNPARTFAFGSFLLIPGRQMLLHGKTPVRIGSRAIDLLTALVERAGELLTKQELISRVWPTTIVEECNLKVNIASIRRALDAHATHGAGYIASVVGRGYRFTEPVATSMDVRSTQNRMLHIEWQFTDPRSFNEPLFGSADAAIQMDDATLRIAKEAAELLRPLVARPDTSPAPLAFSDEALRLMLDLVDTEPALMPLARLFLNALSERQDPRSGRTTGPWVSVGDDISAGPSSAAPSVSERRRNSSAYLAASMISFATASG